MGEPDRSLRMFQVVQEFGIYVPWSGRRTLDAARFQPMPVPIPSPCIAGDGAAA
jgi:hypothetical protein